MKWSVALLVAFLVMLPVVSSRAAEPPDTVMGNWEGTYVGDALGSGSLYAQIIAEGKGRYRAVLSADIGEAQPVRGELRGEKKGEKVAFEGSVNAGPDAGGVYQVKGEIAEGKFAGRYEGQDDRGRFEMKRVQKVPPTLGAKPPEGAIVLFDGKDTSKWVGDGEKPSAWALVEDAMEVVPGKGSIRTKDEFGDFRLHIEFRTPFMPEARGQGRGNSGVYLPGNNEIQVLDSFGLKKTKYDCGAFYGQAEPLENACLPPGEWQTYDVTFIAPRFDAAGKMTESATITVVHNGTKIYDQFRPARPGAPKGRILLQDHDNKVQYRNIWLVPLKAE
jgi:hypothetical protein